jgi:hypothetical protein
MRSLLRNQTILIYPTIRTNPPLREHLSLANPLHLMIPHVPPNIVSTGCFGGDIVSFDAWSAQTADEDTIGSGFRYNSVFWAG